MSWTNGDCQNQARAFFHHFNSVDQTVDSRIYIAASRGYFFVVTLTEINYHLTSIYFTSPLHSKTPFHFCLFVEVKRLPYIH